MPIIRHTERLHQTLVQPCIAAGRLSVYQLQHIVEHLIVLKDYERLFYHLQDSDFLAAQKSLPNGAEVILKDIKYAFAHSLFSELPLEKSVWLLKRFDQMLQSQNEIRFEYLTKEFQDSMLNNLREDLPVLPKEQMVLVLLWLMKENAHQPSVCQGLLDVYQSFVYAFSIVGTISMFWFVEWLLTPNLLRLLPHLGLTDQREVYKSLCNFQHRFSDVDWVWVEFVLNTSVYSLSTTKGPIEDRIVLVERILSSLIGFASWHQDSIVEAVILHIVVDRANRRAWLGSQVGRYLEEQLQEQSWLADFRLLVETEVWTETDIKAVQNKSILPLLVRHLKDTMDLEDWKPLLLTLMQYNKVGIVELFLDEDVQLAKLYIDTTVSKRFRGDRMHTFVMRLPTPEALVAIKEIDNTTDYIACAMELYRREDIDRESFLLDVIQYSFQQKERFYQKNWNTMYQFLLAEMAVLKKQQSVVEVCFSDWPLSEHDRYIFATVAYHVFEDEHWRLNFLERWWTKYDELLSGTFDWQDSSYPWTITKTLDKAIQSIVGPYIDSYRCYTRMQKFAWYSEAEVLAIIQEQGLESEVQTLMESSYIWNESTVRLFECCLSPASLQQWKIKRTAHYQLQSENDPTDTYALSMSLLDTVKAGDRLKQGLTIEVSDGLPIFEALNVFIEELTDVSQPLCHQFLKKVQVKQGKYDLYLSMAKRLEYNEDMVGLEEVSSKIKRAEYRQRMAHYITRLQAKQGNWHNRIPLMLPWDIFTKVPTSEVQTVLPIVLERVIDFYNQYHVLRIHGFVNWAKGELSFVEIVNSIEAMLECVQDPDLPWIIFKELNVLFREYATTNLMACREILDSTKQCFDIDNLDTNEIAQQLIEAHILLQQPNEVEPLVAQLQSSIGFLSDLAGQYPEFEVVLLGESVFHPEQWSVLDWQNAISTGMFTDYRKLMKQIVDVDDIDIESAQYIFQQGTVMVQAHFSASIRSGLVSHLLCIGIRGRCDMSSFIHWIKVSTPIDELIYSHDLFKYLQCHGERELATQLLRWIVEETPERKGVFFARFAWVDIVLYTGLSEQVLPFWLLDIDSHRIGDLVKHPFPHSVRRTLHQHAFRSNMLESLNDIIDDYIEAGRLMELQDLLLSSVHFDCWNNITIHLQKRLYAKKMFTALKRSFLYAFDSKKHREMVGLMLLLLVGQEDATKLNLSWLERCILSNDI